MNHIREELAAVLREIHLAENSQYRQDADTLLASPIIRRIQSDAWLEGHAAGRDHQDAGRDPGEENPFDDAECAHDDFATRQLPGALLRFTCHDCGQVSDAPPIDPQCTKGE